MTGKLETTQERFDKNGNLHEVIVRPTIAERHAAAELAISYVEGKAPQAHLVATVDMTPREMRDADLQARVVDILARYADRAALPTPPARDQLPEASDPHRTGESTPGNSSGD